MIPCPLQRGRVWATSSKAMCVRLDDLPGVCVRNSVKKGNVLAPATWKSESVVAMVRVNLPVRIDPVLRQCHSGLRCAEGRCVEYAGGVPCAIVKIASERHAFE